MLHIICALKPEAQPLLDHFDLRPQPGVISIYQNQESLISLTLSGSGKAAAAAAVVRTRDHFKADRSHAWLNLGIAGHISLPLGQAVIIKKVADACSGQTWFPSRVFSTTLPAYNLLTLDQPSSNYREQLFDMECAGFFQAVTGFATLELVQTVKIIADNAEQPLSGISSVLVSRLMTQSLPAVEDIIQQLVTLSKLQQRGNDPSPDYHAIINNWHFSVSQQHQLQAALRRRKALYPGSAGLAVRLAGKKSAAEVLRFLKDELDNTPIKLR